MTPVTFRMLVAASLSLLCVSAAVTLFAKPALPTVLAAWVDAQRTSGWTIAESLGLTALLVQVASSFGLLLLMPWSRFAYATSVVVGTIVTLFFGPLVTTALEMFLSSADLLLSGVVIGVAWFSEMRSVFERERIPR
jgi:hypothetical protein